MPGVLSKSVNRELNFLSPDLKEKPYYYRIAPPGKPGSNIVYESKSVNIVDLRSLSEEEVADFTLDTAGFQIVKHESLEKEFRDEGRIRDAYYKETEELLKNITGATRVCIFDHTLRRRKAGEEDTPQNRGPSLRVHADQTPFAAEARLKLHIPEEADKLSKFRMQIINVWRPIQPVVNTPLAYADFRTVDASYDLVPTDLIYPDRAGENYQVRYNPAQRWYYYRNQQPDEVVLLKCYESEEIPGRAQLTPHSAFMEPDVPEGTPPRESIEIRALVFYEK